MATWEVMASILDGAVTVEGLFLTPEAPVAALRYSNRGRRSVDLLVRGPLVGDRRVTLAKDQDRAGVTLPGLDLQMLTFDVR